MASSIQPNFAASSTRHCSRVTVRYQGIVDAALVGRRHRRVHAVHILRQAGLKTRLYELGLASEPGLTTRLHGHDS